MNKMIKFLFHISWESKAPPPFLNHSNYGVEIFDVNRSLYLLRDKATEHRVHTRN
jgi:hypothetical protein